MNNNIPDPAMVERFKTAVGRRLSGLQEDPWLAQKILNDGRQESIKTEHRRRTAAAVAVLLGVFVLTFVTIDHTGIIISDKSKQEQYSFNPVESPSPSPGIVLPGQDAFGDGTAICFGGPQIIHYPDGKNGEYINRMENALNLRALLRYDILQQSPAFQSIPLDGAFYPVEMEDDWLILGSHTSDADVSFTTLEKPSMEISRTEDQYTAHVYGGRFKVTYADEIWQSAQATVIGENGAPFYDSDPAYRVDAHYTTQELPFDFTFTITVPPDLCFIVDFGEDFAGVLHYSYADGTQSDFTSPKDTAAFMEADFQSDRFEASSSFTYSDGPLEWQDEWLSITDIRTFPKAPTAFETVLKPECHVRYYNDRYSVHITGGLLRIQYASDFWFTVPELSDESSYDSSETMRVTMATAEVPFDFTFTLPLPEIEDDD